MTPDGFPTVGIVGGGQLARMMIQAAIPLGIGVRLLSERADDSAARVCPEVDLGSPDDIEALRAFARTVDVVTLDHELVDLDALEAILADGGEVNPKPATLEYAKDKLHQRTRFSAAGLPVPAFADTPTLDDLVAFGDENGWPVVAKAQRGGYDGRGVWILEDRGGAEALFAETTERGVPLMAEAFVPIRKELAVLVARRPSGGTAIYPIVETVQRGGICHEVLAPAPVPPEVAAEALLIGGRVAELTSATGIVATELFWAEDGRLLINEIATRPHNSGHFSIDGCVTSQFENHLRAVLDWPLGATDLVAPAVVMANLLGQDSESLGPRMQPTLEDDRARVHLYGKGVRPGRKIGHINVLGDDLDETRERAMHAAAVITGAHSAASQQRA
ncbi:MAG: 5-(carboxyamino)imidazole ribonucleotide synthase [Dehalococcoidia bacterium]|nr:5-(carboxyamino)imidazole ribonucleotide synthase [Dehalococcoidia bacterium]